MQHLQEARRGRLLDKPDGRHGGMYFSPRNIMKPEIQKAYQTIEDIKIKLRRGASYDDCKVEAIEPLQIINLEGERIAKEYGKKHKKLTFQYLTR